MSYDGGDAAAQPAAIGGSIFTYRGTGICIKLDTFLNILAKGEEPLVIVTSTGYFTKIYKYVTAYKGFVFFTESLDKLEFGSNIEVIYAHNLSTSI
ncbi:hypothetical protein [Dolichospermum circinale]|uniref:hypothetical protein n=1 Tax=Dolichospermum circinale TaxID=109265 RepID=UPI0004023B6A|nr:hypothetical protein [Dolichospermum circinale]MDB9475789.1 hypothetical protein [Dolichospermum circinale CS-537/11]MDB9479738.1 hypothetical protein [Dolichospermum circinale CS-537/03]MDB9482173.1 hypothetical protein [Dolichospermum circinale CS-537/05]